MLFVNYFYSLCVAAIRGGPFLGRVHGIGISKIHSPSLLPMSFFAESTILSAALQIRIPGVF
jgi:hypothetical protein